MVQAKSINIVDRLIEEILFIIKGYYSKNKTTLMLSIAGSDNTSGAGVQADSSLSISKCILSKLCNSYNIANSKSLR